MTKKDQNSWKYWQLFWRSWAIQASWNYERQMSMGFMHGIAPIIDKIYDEPRDKRKEIDAYERHVAYYNCTPQTSSFVLGPTVSMEEQYAEDQKNFNPETISALRTSLMGPLSGIGDSFFQGTVRVSAFGFGINLAQQDSILGPILIIIISFIPSFFVIYCGGKVGYNTGNKYLAKLYQEGLMGKVMYVCMIIGLMVIGVVTISMIGITTPLRFGRAFVLQDVLGNIMPQSILLGLTFFMYWLLQKKVRAGLMLTICIAGGVLLSLCGIFS